MPFAARVGDMHSCAQVSPGVPPTPHVGGPIIGKGAEKVLIGGQPAALMGDKALCVGPPDTLIKGSATVMITGKAAVRMGDPTEHGGSVLLGFPTVQIGG